MLDVTLHMLKAPMQAKQQFKFQRFAGLIELKKIGHSQFWMSSKTEKSVDNNYLVPHIEHGGGISWRAHPQLKQK